MNTENPSTNISEVYASRILGETFSQVFSKVVVLTNLIFPTGAGSAVRSAEIDALVICNAGVFVFEVKGWHNCTVMREKATGGEPIWSLYSTSGYSKTVRDPLQQIGGKIKVISPYLTDALLCHLAEHTKELANTVDAISKDAIGERLTHSVQNIVSRIKQPHIRARSYVLLPMDGIELSMNIPPMVLCRHELRLMVRQLVHETKRDKGSHVPFTDAMVERLAKVLHEAGKVITPDQHIENVTAVHGCEEEAAAVSAAAAAAS